MKLSSTEKPVGFLEQHASEIIEEINKSHQTVLITNDGEARAVLMDIQTYQDIQESLSLLKILALSNENLKAGKYRSINDSFQAIRNQISGDLHP